MVKSITIVRGDSDIGAAVACSLSRNPAYKVKAAVVDINDHRVQEMKSCNVDVVQCNLKDVNSIKDILIGTNGCFAVTTSDFSNPQFVDDEIEQGQNIADACAAAKVSHVVFNTQLHPFKITGISARHLVSKAEIEGYMRQIGIPTTFILIPCLYEDYFSVLKPIKTGPGLYEIVIPMGVTPFNMISSEDIGDIVSTIFTNKDAFLDKTLSICGDKLTIREMAGYLSRSLVPTQFKQRQLTANQYAQLGEPWSLDYANMFDFFLRVDQRYNLQETRKICPKTQTFDEWVRKNVGKLKSAFP